jgi:putative transposase
MPSTASGCGGLCAEWESRRSARCHAWQAGAGTQDIPVSVAWCRDRAAEPSVVRRRPEIFNTDRGCQLTRSAFTDALTAAGVRISMDGRGRWMDNLFIGRLWRSLKREDVYLKGCADGREAHSGIAEWFGFYSNTRLHQALGSRTPMAVWRERISGGLPEMAVDMTLRLNNAKILPTCPQQPQQIAA